MKFIDRAKIFLKAGAGGNGCISFRREKYVPRGGPDGGDGGSGGSIFLVGEKKLHTLYDLHLKPHYKAPRGAHGKGKKMQGSSGKDIYIKIPLGVVVYNNGRIIGEILHHQQELLVAHGGKGGRGNVHFTSAVDRSPRTAEEGKPGEEKTLQLVLKLISDIGLVGLPNSGKSTLLKAMTNALPKIGDYPFTTLSPNLGVLQNGFKNIVIADMPGIIKGAHQGKGLGHAFLKHIERTKKIILVIDITKSYPLSDYKSIITEFTNYNKALLEKARLIVFNKIDLVENIPRFSLEEKIFYTSAKYGTGVDELIKFVN